MQRLISFTQVTLDGYFTGKNGDLGWAHEGQEDAEWNAFVSGNAGGGGRLLFGRITYELMVSYWPTPVALERDPAVAKGMNALPKVVFSRTLEKVSWENTRLVKGDLATEVRKLKHEPGEGMVILGSGSIVSQLTQAGLIDEYQIVVKPVALGAGRTMFDGLGQKLALKLAKTRAFTNGNVLLTYESGGGEGGAVPVVELSEQLFRRESGRMVAALTRIFGVHNLALAEDVVQDAFCRALEVWRVRGMPENPSAWLMATAKNRALDVVRRERTARTFAPEMGRLLETEWTIAPLVDEAFAAHTIHDEQLRMMFSCCDPRLSEDVQVALVLNILCGFGAHEIASAFLSGRAAVEKRISRGKKVLASSRRLFDLADDEFASRLSAVRRALYLLFNEGYHGASGDGAVRVELCGEAMRLTALVRGYPAAATPATDALAALMCLHAARLPARLDSAGELHSLAHQDRSRWDAGLLAEGLALLERSAAGPEMTAYHIEAAIAAAHASAPSVEETDWASIVSLYDRLMEVAPSPVVALNRAIAIAECDGANRGLEELHAIAERARLSSYPFYPAAMGELELRRGNREVAREHFQAAIGLARNATERRFLEKRLGCCGGP